MKYIYKYYKDIFRNVFAETVMGISLHDYDLEFQQRYIEAVHRMNAIIIDR